MKYFILSLLAVLPLSLYSQAPPDSPKILMVVSSYGKDLGETRPGYEFDEFSQAYLIFKNNGLVIDVASPKGGKVEADAFNTDKLYNKILMDDQEAMKLLQNTIPTAKIVPDEYDAIYVVGGKGAMFDLPYDPSLQDIILNMYQRDNAVISAVCHGPAAFVNVKNGDDYIVEGIEMTGFTNIEEQLFGKKWVGEFPFSLEDRMTERGAEFLQTDFMLSKVAVSGKFITGQNPFSSTRSAEEVVRVLGLDPVERTVYTDEKSAYLIQDLLDGEKTYGWAADELENYKDTYDIPIIAVYGYYKIMAANEDRAAIDKGIQLIELIKPHFFDENLWMAMAKTYHTIGEQEKAKAMLDDLVEKDLLREQAEKMLSEME